jgi:hypothetical protein
LLARLSALGARARPEHARGVQRGKPGGLAR